MMKNTETPTTTRIVEIFMGLQLGATLLLLTIMLVS